MDLRRGPIIFSLVALCSVIQNVREASGAASVVLEASKILIPVIKEVVLPTVKEIAKNVTAKVVNHVSKNPDAFPLNGFVANVLKKTMGIKDENDASQERNKKDNFTAAPERVSQSSGAAIGQASAPAGRYAGDPAAQAIPQYNNPNENLARGAQIANNDVQVNGGAPQMLQGNVPATGTTFPPRANMAASPTQNTPTVTVYSISIVQVPTIKMVTVPTVHEGMISLQHHALSILGNLSLHPKIAACATEACGSKKTVLVEMKTIIHPPKTDHCSKTIAGSIITLPPIFRSSA
jgi:hypothetical protein